MSEVAPAPEGGMEIEACEREMDRRSTFANRDVMMIQVETEGEEINSGRSRRASSSVSEINEIIRYNLDCE